MVTPPSFHAPSVVVLSSRDMFGHIVQFQHGIPQDVVPLAIITSSTTATFLGWIAMHGEVRLARLLSCIPHLRPVVVLFAVAATNLTLLDTLNLDIDDDDNLVDVAAITGNLPGIVALFKMGYYAGTNRALMSAATSGHLDIVVYLCVHRKLPCTKAVVNASARMGHLPIVQWCHEYGAQSWTSDGFVGAAGGGHVDVVAYMHHAKPRCGSTSLAIDAAASNGHLHVVQFIHSQRPTHGCSINALHGAIAHGHNHVVAYLELHRGDLIQAVCCACGIYTALNHPCKAIA
ncbi:hypothetical protein H257_15293 [Aphanomyces astaci]|uniref:Uncharacterized protein n=2 Tax=Aphanomyces astaci TaxID=112090 RepID=W4FPS5_APHAT|nr:hypothetical protein H257_15293 [Aphanomyces astaci]ETV68956.1 hypothetical protein H257_15293 [Aphanomyces astaci]|eukprot:XP_009841633.1 hypothetical protein H257_15293 [Aphanomyces astaci]